MRGNAVRLTDFGGGVDQRTDPRELAPNVASDLRDVVAGSNGKSLKLRPPTAASGYTTPSSSDVVNMVNSEPALGGFLFSTTNGRIFRPGATALYTPGVLTAGTGYGWSIAQGYLSTAVLWLFMHPTITPQVWNGVTATTANWNTAGGLPTGSKAIHSRANRVWAIKGDTLRWSDIADIDTWPAANTVTPIPGENWQAIGDCGPYIVLFGWRSIVFVYDFDTGANRIVSTTRGILRDTNLYHSRAFASSEDGVYFHDGDSWLHLSSSEQFTHIGDPVKPLGVPSQPSTVFDGRWLYVQHSPTRILVYDAALKSWWIQQIASGALARHLQYGLAIGPTTALTDITRWNPEMSEAAHSAPLDAYWKREGLDFGSSKRKRIRQAQVICDFPATVPTAMLLLAVRDGVTESRTLTFGTDGVARPTSFGVGREWEIRVVSQEAANWELNELVFWMNERQD